MSVRFFELGRLGFRLLLADADSKYQWARAALLLTTGGIAGAEAIHYTLVFAGFLARVLIRLDQLDQLDQPPINDPEFERERQRLIGRLEE